MDALAHTTDTRRHRNEMSVQLGSPKMSSHTVHAQHQFVHFGLHTHTCDACHKCLYNPYLPNSNMSFWIPFNVHHQMVCTLAHTHTHTMRAHKNCPIPDIRDRTNQCEKEIKDIEHKSEAEAKANHIQCSWETQDWGLCRRAQPMYTTKKCSSIHARPAGCGQDSGRDTATQHSSEAFTVAKHSIMDTIKFQLPNSNIPFGCSICNHYMCSLFSDSAKSSKQNIHTRTHPRTANTIGPQKPGDSWLRLFYSTGYCMLHALRA